MTDSQVFIHTWHREGSKSQELSDATKALFGLISRRNLHLQLFRVPSNENAVDGPSRRFSESDSMLSSQARSRVQAAFWDHCGHSLDLLALDWNAQRDIFGNPLPHLTPFTLKGSAGINLFAQCPSSGLKIWENPYAFPPSAWLVRYCSSFSLSHYIYYWCAIVFSASGLVAGSESRII